MQMTIGLEGWIMQDGNYKDFAVGEEREFALEYGPKRLPPGSEKTCHIAKPVNPSIEHIEEHLYDMTGQFSFIYKEFNVVDFGMVKAYARGNWRTRDSRDELPSTLIGEYITGHFYLAVDPFFWKESRRHYDHFPNITEKWRIDEILFDVTPVQLVGRTWTPVQEERIFKSLDKTNMWKDTPPGMNIPLGTSYLLNCTLRT